MNFTFIKESWKKCFSQNCEAAQPDNNVSWAANQHDFWRSCAFESDFFFHSHTDLIDIFHKLQWLLKYETPMFQEFRTHGQHFILGSLN